ncbi:hypothetical protein AKJ39_00515 [candidate division MSBL1 archaeon SCGC-AAA259J03]|uniref:Nmd3 N-terminal domain-containing protein n=1 Tax=candidate division MSBL1 archaeon SCGC-AAA259J03 TaxID=1698269 RepID=A0A656YXE5_9EURY|nr:hypothetical protein AKJ39_00515 [candidate division MSBL1 archaeon SCGC-AAA259J03]
MPKKFCYKCGNLEEENSPLIEGLCRDCFLSENPLIEAPEQIELKTCKQCGAYYIDGTPHDLEKNPTEEYLEASKELASSKAKVLQKTPTGLQYEDFKDSKGVNIGFDADYTSPEDIKVEMNVRVKLPDTQEPFTEKETVNVKITETTCEVCSKRKSGYYEALLQVRGEEQISEDRKTEILQTLREEFLRIHDRNREEFVTKIQEKHGGIDLYTSSAKLAKSLASLLKREYGAKISKSAELIGQTEDGRERYRVTVIARIPN